MSWGAQTDSAVAQALYTQATAQIADHEEEITRHERIISDVVTEHGREILQHKHAVAVLRSQVNAMRPVARLPDEILTEIFVICAANYRDPPVSTPKSRMQPSTQFAQYMWIRVAHVCHRWRDVAIKCSGLWSHIVCYRPDLTEEWLRRSGSAPLDVRWKGSWSATRPVAKRSLDAFLLALQELPRIQNLEISAPRFNQTYEAFVQCWPQVDAPLLQSVTLTTVINWYGTGGGIPIIKRLLDGNPRQLKRLIIRDNYLRWEELKSSALASLTYLNFASGPWGDVLHTILSVLSDCVSLEKLELAEIRPMFVMVPPQDVASLPKVELPSAREVSLTANPFLAIPLIDRLVLPPTVKIDLDYSPDSSLPQQGSTISASMIRHFGWDPQRHVDPILTFAIQGERCCFLKLDGWRTPLTEPPSLPGTPQPDISMTFDLCEIPGSYLHWTTVFDALGTAPATRVRTLCIRALHRYAFHTDFRKAFAQMLDIDTLHVTEWTSRELLRLLYTRRAAHAEEVFMPKLRSLYLHQVSFPMHPRQETDVQDLGLLLDRLASRRAHGAPLLRIVLDCCFNLTDGDIEQLSHYAEELVWDHRMDVGSPDQWAEPEPEDFDEDDINWEAEIQLDDDY